MPSERPEILSYSPAPSRSSSGQILLRTFLFLIGIGGGALAMVFLGLALWKASGNDSRPWPHPLPIWPAFVFLAILIAAFTSCVVVFRRFRKAAKWLAMGFFIAAGFASLAEGFCFLNQ